MGHIDPTRPQFEAFKALPRDTPLNMLNLVRVHARATYPNGREATGHEAYQAYGRESLPIFERVGGRILWRGAMEHVLVGPTDERWDFCFVAYYPHAGAMLEMLTDPAYREAVKHRQAAVEDSRLIRLGELPGGAGFAL